MTTIPPMTHPLSSGWPQPSTRDITLDNTHALMDAKTFDHLLEYSCSQPSGVYDGKMWKSNTAWGWLLRWFGPSDDPDKCSVNFRVILIA